MSPRHRKPIPEPDHDTAAALHTVAPVPTTSIFSESDGVVAWQCSINPARHAHTENIEVQGARGCFFRVAHPPEVVTQRN